MGHPKTPSLPIGPHSTHLTPSPSLCIPQSPAPGSCIPSWLLLRARRSAASWREQDGQGWMAPIHPALGIVAAFSQHLCS